MAWQNSTVSSNFKPATWRTAGYQPHSVRVGDMWYRMNHLGPLGIYLSIAADLYDVAHDAAQGDMLALSIILSKRDNRRAKHLGQRGHSVSD